MPKENDHENMLRDERGKKSFFRTWLQIWLLNMLAMVWADLLTSVKLEALHVEVMVVGFFVLGAGAGGPRMAQYLLPQLGKVVQSLASIRRDKREPNPRADDESG